MKKKVHIHGPAVGEDEDGAPVKGTLVTTCEPEPETFLARPVKSGEPLIPGSEIASFTPIKGDDEHFMYETHKVPGKRPSKSKKGPAVVATASYRDGWDRIWGGTKKGPLN
jgi:hypothetical protein